jgi:hypothetical protein
VTSVTLLTGPICTDYRTLSPNLMCDDKVLLDDHWYDHKKRVVDWSTVIARVSSIGASDLLVEGACAICLTILWIVCLEPREILRVV